MENLVKNNITVLKSYFFELISKLKTEIPLPIFLGALPVVIFSNKESDVNEMLKALLAGNQLMKYYFYILFLYALVIIIKIGVRLSHDSSRQKLEYIHEIIGEVGTGFLTISRTGIGAAMGCLYLVHTTEIISATPSELFRTYASAFILLIFNCAIVFAKDRATKTIYPRRPQNPYKIDKLLK
ncbi:hypothetical protein ACIPZ5_00320 [Pseudomonas sp. NPDC089428]|uniref:hypothetical protein n=1 Tax=Pseudomonas sp. NPDC089428 TaxID=3364467 RepID=UPI0037FA98AE